MLRVIIVDDQAIVSESLRIILDSSPETEVVATAGNGFEAVEKCRALAPDIVIMDIKMPQMNGLDAAGLIKKECMNTKVAIFTSSEDAGDVRAALSKGVDAYLLKDTPSAVLSQLIRFICEGYCIISNSARDFIAQNMQMDGGPADSAAKLDEESRKIIGYLGEARSTGEISEALLCSEEAVEKKIEAIFRKTGVETKAELVIAALKRNII